MIYKDGADIEIMVVDTSGRPRPQWAAVGRELMRLGFVAQSEGEYATLELTTEGIGVLKTREAITLTKPMALPKVRKVVRREGDIEGLRAVT